MDWALWEYGGLGLIAVMAVTAVRALFVSQAQRLADAEAEQRRLRRHEVATRIGPDPASIDGYFAGDYANIKAQMRELGFVDVVYDRRTGRVTVDNRQARRDLEDAARDLNRRATRLRDAVETFSAMPLPPHECDECERHVIMATGEVVLVCRNAPTPLPLPTLSVPTPSGREEATQAARQDPRAEECFCEGCQRACLTEDDRAWLAGRGYELTEADKRCSVKTPAVPAPRHTGSATLKVAVWPLAIMAVDVALVWWLYVR